MRGRSSITLKIYILKTFDVTFEIILGEKFSFVVHSRSVPPGKSENDAETSRGGEKKAAESFRFSILFNLFLVFSSLFFVFAQFSFHP